MKNSILNKNEINEKIEFKKKKFEENLEKRREKFEQKIEREKDKLSKKAELTKERLKEADKIDEKPRKTSIWRLLAYFIIYSFLGYVIETIFAIFNYGVWESRQSFLYGPFCCIYGLGAAIIILVLRYRFFKNNHTLFVGGFIVG